MGADVALLIVAFAALFLGYPVALTLGGTAIVFTLAGSWFGWFDPFLLRALPARLFGIVTNQVLMAIPLFVVMGLVLEKSGIAEDMFHAFAARLKGIRGGFAMSVTLVGMLLAASTGIAGASVVTLGVLALPVLLRYGQDGAHSVGSVAAAGTLGQIIPPSIVLIVLGDQMSNAYQQAQSAQGSFASDTVSVPDLFAGALLPGLLLVVGYLFLNWLFSTKQNPEADDTADMPAEEQMPSMLRAGLPPLLLMIVVLGSILAGVATPTESAVLGVAGALLLACREKQVGGVSVQVTALAGLALIAAGFLVPLPGIAYFLLVIGTIGLCASTLIAFHGMSDPVCPAMRTFLPPPN